MREVVVGSSSYRIHAVVDRTGWLAHAVKSESGERFGAAQKGASEAGAEERVEQWLRWQFDHEQALSALQQAERAYHRAVADHAFASADEAPASSRRQLLEAIEAAKMRLDVARARRPSDT